MVYAACVMLVNFDFPCSLDILGCHPLKGLGSFAVSNWPNSNTKSCCMTQTLPAFKLLYNHTLIFLSFCSFEVRWYSASFPWPAKRIRSEKYINHQEISKFCSLAFFPVNYTKIKFCLMDSCSVLKM